MTLTGKHLCVLSVSCVYFCAWKGIALAFAWDKISPFSHQRTGVIRCCATNFKRLERRVIYFFVDSFDAPPCVIFLRLTSTRWFILKSDLYKKNTPVLLHAWYGELDFR